MALLPRTLGFPRPELSLTRLPASSGPSPWSPLTPTSSAAATSPGSGAVPMNRAGPAGWGRCTCGRGAGRLPRSPPSNRPAGAGGPGASSHPCPAGGGAVQKGGQAAHPRSGAAQQVGSRPQPWAPPRRCAGASRAVRSLPWGCPPPHGAPVQCSCSGRLGVGRTTPAYQDRCLSREVALPHAQAPGPCWGLGADPTSGRRPVRGGSGKAQS